MFIAALTAAHSSRADPTTASDDSGSRRGSLEIAPFAGLQLGGGFKLTDTGEHVDLSDHGSFALSVGMWSDNVSMYELFYGRESTSMHGAALPPTGIVLEYLHVGGSVALDEELPVKPYLLGGLGATRLKADSALADEDTRFSASLGAGLRVPFRRHLSVRLEARGFLTLVNGDSAVFCHSGESGLICRIHARGSSFFQLSLLTGVAYTF